MEVPGRVEMRAVVGRELHLLDRPALPVRQVLRLQPLEELQHARQALLVIDVLDGRMPARRIGRHVVLQGNGDVDQFARHGVGLDQPTSNRRATTSFSSASLARWPRSK
jgi:hypothetical protein